MKRFIFIFLLATCGILPAIAQIKLRTADFTLYVSTTGQLTEFSDPSTGKNYLAVGEMAPLMKIRVDSVWEEPTKADFNLKSGIISLTYTKSKITAEVKVNSNKTHLSFYLTKLSNKDKVEAVCWGPYPTIIGQTIGELIGVVRDGNYGIGIQALNVKTIGGLYANAGGVDERIMGSVAKKQPYGSSLQAYSIDRSKPRKVNVWGKNYPNMPVAPIPGETTIGSAIALFGCPENKVLDHIGAIELAEGLPHPLINGIWHKQSPETGRAYLIADFNEKNVDEMLEYTKQAGLMTLYHEGPFKTWGHFDLDPVRFPSGNAGMKTCVDKASKLGLRIGVHTLSTFITTNDAYVTPIPDKRLALTGSTVITENLNPSSTEISIESDQYFKNIKPSALHAARIGDEIIRFREVSKERPYKLLDCQRGVYGTKASSHDKGENLGMMMDYNYRTLFPNFELQQEMAGNLVRFFNETGVSQMDFDGHEGCFSSGEGDYGKQAFADKVLKEVKHTLVNGSSRANHYYWHNCHYWNWGEPWYGGFRESQSDYRIKNQPFLEQNYMPNMLGWFLISSTTDIEDIDWMMARAAGFNAGFGLVARYDNLKHNPNTPQLLALVKLWQEASKNKIFSQNQLARLKNTENDFHLEKDDRSWKLYPFNKYKFEHTQKTLQPGESTSSEWNFENKDAEQPLNFTLTFLGKGGKVVNPWIELDGYYRLEIAGTFEIGTSVVCTGKSLKVYNNKGSYQNDIPVQKPIPSLKVGKHTLSFDCQFLDNSELSNRFIIKTKGNPEVINK